ncbi:TonB-dependent receptor [Constantimarinum furrinae]|uniref:Outer membrane receptor protein n=1 Tax=Constantimarinum furrinae TaxID=2562285 RepID=A0A7G8PWC8_9FLAO|nr:TonB-dependent receptor [Constantimarinum furrinae]QNJ98644.1 Outer membrane receptor protein [Constantimarinum furrinae]
MKLFKFMLLGLICIPIVHAQNSLTGTITNAETNEALMATVYLPSLEKGTVSNLDGGYTITNIPNGNYTVIFSALGFETVSRKISFSEGNTIQLNMVLAESAVEMDAVIISTPFHKLQRDNVMKVERVSTEMLNRSGAITISEGISNIPGVSAISTGTGINKPVIRGLSSNRVLTYTQGVRLENQQFGDEHGLGLNGFGIESVEVIKGPASLLYGSDALGGVLYLNPESFAAANSTNADAETRYFTNTLGSSSSVGLRTSSEKFKFLVRGSYSTQSDYKTGDDQRVTNSRFQEYDLKSGLQYQGDIVRSTLRYNLNSATIGIPEEIGIQTTSKDKAGPFQEIDNHVLSLENNIFLNNSSLDLKVGYLFNDRKEFEALDEDAELRLQLNTFNYDLKYNLPDLGKFETIAGIQGLFQENKNFGEEVLIPDATTTDFGLFGTTHLHFETIDLQAGLRYDFRKIDSETMGTAAEGDLIEGISRTFNSFNAALGAKWDVDENTLIRLNFASGFRAPNLAELTSNGVHEGTNRYEIGNPDLKNEQNFQTDLSIEYGNEHFELFANGFYNVVSDYIFVSPTDEIIDNTNVFRYVQQDAVLYGGEVGLHLHPHPLDWLHLESTFETVTGTLRNDDPLPLIPANSLKNTIRTEFERGKVFTNSSAFLSYENVFKQSRTGLFETPTGSYNLLSAGANGTLLLGSIELDLGVTVSNLLNETYVAHLSRLKADGVPNIGRNVLLRLKATI